mgnify:CR=1 FL=1
MSEPTITALVFIKNFLTLIAAAIGSLISLKFIKRESPKKGWALALDNASLLFGGSCASVFLSPAIVEYLGLTERATYAVYFLIGMFGLSVAYQINEQIGPLLADIRRKFLGSDSGGVESDKQDGGNDA